MILSAEGLTVSIYTMPSSIFINNEVVFNPISTNQMIENLWLGAVPT